MSAYFTPEYVESIKPFIQETVDKVLNRMIEKGCDQPMDLVESFSLPVPSIVGSTPVYVSMANGQDHLRNSRRSR